jgi:hypothetical protein
MSEIANNNFLPSEHILTHEQLRSFPGMDKYSDDELKEVAAFLKEFSLILYDAATKNVVDQK